MVVYHSWWVLTMTPFSAAIPINGLLCIDTGIAFCKWRHENDFTDHFGWNFASFHTDCGALF